MRVKEAPQKFHFLGICGTAMGSVAAALQERGFKVSGSDENVYPPMSIFLQKKGIALNEGYRAENIPADADVVVIGNAMKRSNPEVEAVLNRKLFYLSLPEVLKNYFLRGRHNLVVTGTHGKTTTTAILAWIMEKAGRKPGFLIGGIPKNCAQRIRDVAYSTDGSRFKLGDNAYEIPLVGEFNVRNAAMAATAARFYDVPQAKIDNALKSFSGIARRQEVRGEARGVKVIDDFGHHPTAISQTLEALRHRYPGCRVWAIFEPRSNTTRRAVFQKELPEAFKLADGVFISQVARLEQIPEMERLNPEAVVDAIAQSGHPGFYEPNADAIVDRIVPMLKPKDIVVVFSNGGFDNIHQKLLNRLSS